MSLTYGQIETLLLSGVSFSAKQREFVAKTNPDNDRVIVTEMSDLAQISLPVEFVVDRAEAHESGSKVADIAVLKQPLGELTIGAI